ncbi:MAG: hypothetical protein EOP45_08990, partial [Sphingobacteriaceae bacterium]
MDQKYPIDPSTPELDVNFRIFDNDVNTIEKIKSFQINKIELKENERYKEIEHKIYTKNGAPFILINTNLNERPLKLLIDTGASISLISKTSISEKINRTDLEVNIFGIVGKDVSVRTEGMVNAIFKIEEHYLSTTLHVVDKQYAGPGDGYLGYDFFAPYKVIIDMNKMCLRIHINEIITDPIQHREKIKSDHPINYEGKIIVNNVNIKPIKSNRRYSENLKINKNKEEYFEVHNYDDNDKNLNERIEFIYENLKLQDCNEEEKKTVKEICKAFPYQFHLKGDTLGYTTIMEHTIDLIPGSKPVNVRQYRIPQTLRKIMEDIVKDFEQQGIIEKCQSKWNSPAILVSKNDEFGTKTDHRFVVDYRKLNEITEISCSVMPLIEDVFAGLGGNSYYTCIDLKHAFYHLNVKKSQRDYTSFSVGNFQYRFIRMPMGLATAPLSWQKTVNLIFDKLIGKGVYVYLDDVIIYAKTKEEHDKILWEVMDLLEEHNLQLNITKCTFYAKTFEYLGHIISKDGTRVNPKKVEVINNFPRPITVRHIQSFLGMCNYFRKYVKDFSKVSKPLTLLLKKETPFIWTDSQQKAFEHLKKALSTEVVLSFPDFSDLFYVSTDASNVAIGAVLMQKPGGGAYRPIYYFSRTLNDAQRRYSTIEKELLAIVEAVKTFRVYLYGRFFVLLTDHKPL